MAENNYENENYKMEDNERNQLNERIRRKYVRKKPLPEERTEAQKMAVIKMREGLEKSKKLKEQMKKNGNYSRSINLNKEEKKEIKNKVNKVTNNIIHDVEPVYKDEYESDQDGEEFMIKDNTGNLNYIVTPVKRRVVEPKQPRKKRQQKKEIEQKINVDRINNIVDHQIKGVEKKNDIKEFKKNITTPIIKQKENKNYQIENATKKIIIQPEPQKKKIFSMLDD